MEPVKLTLRYCGKDVEDGSMSLEDTAMALHGFACAYGKIVKYNNIETKHELRLTEIKKGSCDLIIVAKELIADGTMQTLIVVGSSNIFKILDLMKYTIDLTIHAKNQKFQQNPIINGDNNFVTYINIEGSKLTVPIEASKLFDSKAIAEDIRRIVRPIERGKIDSSSIISTREDGSEFKTEITYEDKPYFEPEKIEDIATKDITLIGRMLSHHKETNNGRFEYGEDKQISYHLAMLNPKNYFSFYLEEGIIVKGIGHYVDSELKKIDIYEIKETQTYLFNEE